MTTLNDLQYITNTFPNTAKMPVFFFGHGSPMNAIEENQFVQGFRNSVKDVQKPTAILCISAHWFTRGTKVTAMQVPETIHDFGGFPKELFAVQYPAPGSPLLAHETQQLLKPMEVALDEEWGLDHGTWSVVKHLYPLADVPVIQLSIDYTKPAEFHFGLGKQLQALRHKGVLIIGSGNIVHNLGLVDFQNFHKDNYGFDWALEARTTINGYLQHSDYQPLLDYDRQGSAFKLAIPTPDHYLPLLYTLGLQQKEDTLSLFNDKMVAGSLSMTSVKIT
ncbi:4,5-DOPA-extradiol-dioxygenase [Flavobacterium phycosphaerae]|uniref:4,5-DOPA-extradiol-dioxygenase n=1 Tax=Flavobacterium phycosphaerae TaxID=2697515 RepID=UPI00138B14DF|nr:4,5-DOPA dioxygenase extradiol [Flavobacterium phycosphaerae]